MSKKKKILIYGIGSLQNRGCEALVNSTISQIDSDVELTAATFDYEHDKNMYRDRIKKIVNHYRQDEKQFTSKEKELYELLDELDKKGIRFGITNLVYHKGKKNTIFAI